MKAIIITTTIIIIIIPLITFFLLLPPLDFECLFSRTYVLIVNIQ